MSGTRGQGARRRRVQRRAEQRKNQAMSLTAAASGSTSLPLGDRNQTWDAAAADKAVRTWAGATDKPNGKYAQAFFYKGDDGSSYGDYKLGFAQPVNGKLTANWGGITAVAGALQGARGGVQIPDADKTAIQGKVAGYYSKAAKHYNDPKIKPPWKAGDGESAARLLAYAQLGPDADEDMLAIATFEWQEALAAPEHDLSALEALVEEVHAGVTEEPQELAMGACANCDHAYADHLGSEGPCTNGSCDCDGYEAPVTDADGDQNATAAETLADAARAFYSQAAPTGTNGSFTWVENNMRVTFDFMPEGVVITPPAEPSDTGGAEWSAIFAPEGKLTSDGRAFAPGAITWPRLDDGPLSLMAMTETSEGGHIGAQVAGRIDRIWRDDQAGLIRASGTFDTGDYGQEIARLVADQVLRGVSVDLAIHDAQAGPMSDYFDPDGNWAPKPDEQKKDQTGIPLLDALYDPDDPDVFVVFAAEIGATTVCPFPAFGEARIALGDSLVAGASPNVLTVTGQAGFTVQKAAGGPLAASDGVPCAECGDALTASAAGLAPVRPPAAWFDDPGLTEPTGMTVTDEGRVYGHAAVWSSCHIGFPGRCQPPPHSNTGYAYFHLGEIVCDDGSRVACGAITLDTGHAPTGGTVGRAEAVRHYDDTGTVAAYVRCGEDEHGIWFSGALREDVSAEKAKTLMAGKPSGDWRGVDGNLELVAILTVNVPGFPVPRTRQGFAGTDVVSLVAAGIPVLESEISADDLEKFRALREMDELMNAQEAA